MPLDDELEALVPRVYRFARRLTGNVHRAEDLTQETFLRAWRRRGQLRDPRRTLVWLFRIAANLWRDELRRRGVLTEDAELTAEPVDGRMLAPETIADEHEQVERALAALATLPPRQQSVLHLVAVERLSLSEVSEILGITRNAARVNLCLARKRMRELFSEANQSAE
ncbi:MAG TPA: sigma-70 family RNA polymerase sigma factor [Planctomycetaceae bacterium]|nr:sigma-70 family RNA polymerase sigma factor [Planctomycetaceae bacterium]